ncbi:endo alpha-1,4 polygalactosaminidase [Micromonospora citrea]|uniref:endo alpha-1,4 polygalactosaminidase n=1 Tax=Micromonospora citrea TaxID=47855 RepID=UPI003C6B3B52
MIALSRTWRRPATLALLLATVAAATWSVVPDASADQRPEPPARQALGVTTTSAAVTLPPANAVFDYQIGGAYPLPAGVRVVSRDREDAPAAAYTICYVNAFQTQPQETAWWKANHDDLLLRDAAGRYVVDGQWNEILLDISTPDKRARLAGIVGGWIDGCARDGFQAVEPDNMDSYQRSRDRLTRAQALDYVRLLTARADRMSLPVAQKNTVEFGAAGRNAGLDFAVAEECARWTECDRYTDVYGNHVIVIEYTDEAYRTACRTVGDTLSVVRRDVRVSAPGNRRYVYDAC